MLSEGQINYHLEKHKFDKLSFTLSEDYFDCFKALDWHKGKHIAGIFNMKKGSWQAKDMAKVSNKQWLAWINSVIDGYGFRIKSRRIQQTIEQRKIYTYYYEILFNEKTLKKYIKNIFVKKPLFIDE